LLNADQLPALIQLFTAFMDEANYEEALQVIEDSLQRNDRVAQKHLMHSQVLMALGRREEAEAALEEARERNVGDALALPASVDEYVFAQPLEEAPMVRTAAKPVFEQAELTQPSSTNDRDEPAAEHGTQAVALAAARHFLQEQGWQVTHSEQLPPHVLTCRKEGDTQPVEILVKVVPREESRRMVLSQADLDLISAVSPPRGMLVVALTENTDAAAETVAETETASPSSEAAEQVSRVIAFTPSWRPDPFRLVPTRYEYQLPSEQ
jgi:tetratricopeptide (TPR) repeat protein